MQDKFSVRDLFHMDRIKKIYFSSEGRINRLEYFKRFLAFVAVIFVLSFIMNIVFVFGCVFAGLSGEDLVGALENFSNVASVLVFILSLVVQYHLDVRRLHDLNRGNTLAIVRFVTIIIVIPAFLIGIYLLFFKGTTGSNDYGSDPLEYQK